MEGLMLTPGLGFSPSNGKKWVFIGKKTFLPGRNWEETPKGHRVCDNNELIW